MPGQNLTRDEARERARILTVDGYDVALDLRSTTSPTFRSVTTIRFRCAQVGTATFVDLLAPAVHAIALNGEAVAVPAAFDGSRIAVAHLAAVNELTVDASCAYSHTGEGLHRFTDPVDGETYLYTQYEPADSRRVFAGFDQPDLKAPFTLTVTAPAHWTVIGNAEPTGRPAPPPDDPTALVWRFAATPPISTYLTAVVAGPYHVARDHYTRSLPGGERLEIPLAALCRASLAKHFDHDDIFTVTKQGLDFFHNHFAYPYPFGKYDQAFVPEYNIGAMENPGCVTFTEDFVYRGRVTDASYQRRANVILHEMAHMWFGDLVTMRWWDDLWLKESFADYMGALATVEATRFTDGWVSFADRRKTWAYRQDQLPTTHPITADIRDLQDAKLNFDGITYAKGASVLKQLVAYVGRDAFFAGARRYFKRHAYGNTTLDDLLRALAETSGRDLTQWSRAWLQTAGVNTLTPELYVDESTGRLARLAVLQPGDDGRPAPRPHRIAIGLYHRDAGTGALVRTTRVEADITGPRTEIPALVNAKLPDLILLNDDDLTYCKVRFDSASLATLHAQLGNLTDPLARALAWSGVWNLTRDGLLPARDYLDLVRRFAGRERDLGVLHSLHEQARLALNRYVAPQWRSAGERLLAACALAELRSAKPGSDHQLAWARFFATGAAADAARAFLAELLDGRAALPGLEVDQELRWAFLAALAAHGLADQAALDAELNRDNTASGKRHQLRCLTARPSAEAKAAAWQSVVESDTLPNALVNSVIGGFYQPGQAELTAPYADAYFAAIERVWSMRTIEIAMRIVSGLFPALHATQATLSQTDAWLTTHADAAPALRRLVVEARDDLARALRAQAADGAAA